MRNLCRDETRFVFSLLAFGVLVFAGYRESVLGPPLAGLSALTAKATFGALQLLGVPATLDGTVLRHPSGFACEVYFRCTGVLPAVCLTVVILASPGRTPCKLAGIALGVPLLFTLNLARVVHVFVVGVSRPELFGLVHGVIWQAATVAAVVGIWLAWLAAPSAVCFHTLGDSVRTRCAVCFVFEAPGFFPWRFPCRARCVAANYPESSIPRWRGHRRLPSPQPRNRPLFLALLSRGGPRA